MPDNIKVDRDRLVIAALFHYTEEMCRDARVPVEVVAALRKACVGISAGILRSSVDCGHGDEERPLVTTDNGARFDLNYYRWMRKKEL